MGYKKVGYTFGAIVPHGGEICPHIPTIVGFFIF